MSDSVDTLPQVEVGLGCVHLGSASARISQSEQIAVIRAAIDSGVTIFDTADVYGAGASERLLGRAVRDRRDGLTIATKGGYLFAERRPVGQRLRRVAARVVHAIPRSDGTARLRGRPVYAAQDFTPAHVRRSVEGSLRRLGVDHIDVYQLHGPPQQLSDDLFAMLEDLRVSGAIARIGVGAESVGAAETWSSDGRVEVVQMPFGVLDPDAGEALSPPGTGHRARIWARGLLAGGVIAAAMSDPEALRSHPKEHLIQRLSAVAAEAGMGLDELAIRWARSYDGIDAVVLGMSSADHVRRNVELLARPPLEDELMQLVADVTAQSVGGGEPR